MADRSKAGLSGAMTRVPCSSGSAWSPGAAADRALSSVHGTLLMVVITVLLAILILQMALGMIPCWSWTEPPEPPIVIIDIIHTSAETGERTYASRVFLLNNGSTVYSNDDLKAILYRDGQRTCTVQTLNGHLFIPSHHNGVRYLKGEGCRTRYWNPGEVIEVDFSDLTIVPGVRVTMEIVDKPTKKTISRHTVTAWSYHLQRHLLVSAGSLDSIYVQDAARGGRWVRDQPPGAR